MITFNRLGNHGQLGNQMFQYAMLIGVAAKHGYEIRIPKHFARRKRFGLYELDKFKTSSGKLHPRDKRHFDNTYHEKGFGFDPQVLDQPDGTNFEGYFQTERYFEHCSERVREEFTFIDPINRYAEVFVRRNRTSPCIVSIHVRRGDYLNTKDLFQILTPEYYQRAMMHPMIPDKRQWFVFSDDLDWCRQNISNEFTTYVESPSHWHDMAVMSKCDMHIMAASSFSWWGSWLSGTDKVIAPTPWFPRGPRGHYNMSDIVPERWAKLEVVK